MRATLKYIVVTAAVLLALPADAHAMHIADGILPLGWSVLWFLLAAPFVAFGLYRLKQASKAGQVQKPLLGMMAAAVFVISCMPIPVPVVGSCSHATGAAMAAIIIGPAYTVLAAMVALLLQALFLSDGGFTTLGANVFSMGIVGSFVGYAVFKGSMKLGFPLVAAAFFAGVAGDWATYTTTSLELALALSGAGGMLHMFYTIMLAFFVPTQSFIGVLEGFITAGAIRFLYERRPELVGCIK